MRLIDADALCMHLSDWQFGSMTDGKHDAEYEVINKVIDGIEKEPTVDAVQVVRCKDCRWGREVCGNIECFVDSNTPSEYHGYEWFCPNGERRSE